MSNRVVFSSVPWINVMLANCEEPYWASITLQIKAILVCLVIDQGSGITSNHFKKPETLVRHSIERLFFKSISIKKKPFIQINGKSFNSFFFFFLFSIPVSSQILKGDMKEKKAHRSLQVSNFKNAPVRSYNLKNFKWRERCIENDSTWGERKFFLHSGWFEWSIVQ